MSVIGAETIIAAFRRLSEGPEDEVTTLGELVKRLDARAHALVLLLLAAPNLTPGPSMPGFSTLFGLPLCIVAFEMMLGRKHLRLPGFLSRMQITRRRIAALVSRIEPFLHRVQRVLKPRTLGPVGTHADRLLGFACFVLGILLTLPIPVYSLLPALAVVAIALGLLTHDGWAVAAGLALGAVSIGALVVIVIIAVAAFGGS